jgi:hypothetical protein
MVIVVVLPLPQLVVKQMNVVGNAVLIQFNGDDKVTSRSGLFQDGDLTFVYTGSICGRRARRFHFTRCDSHRHRRYETFRISPDYGTCS